MNVESSQALGDAGFDQRMGEHPSQELQIHYGSVSEAMVEVYVHLPVAMMMRATMIHGRVRGPFCQRARTLPSSALLRPAGEPGVWQTTVVDPCFWSAELPSLYRLEIQADDGPRLETEFGMRRFSPFRRHLWHEGRRWVLRGAWWSASVVETDLSVWHDTPLAIVVRDPTVELCREASRQGVLMAVWVPAEQLSHQLPYCARWAAVAVVIVDGEPAQSADELRALAPNLVLAQAIKSSSGPPPASWAQVLVTDEGTPDAVAAAEAIEPARPVMVVRPLSAPVSAAEARVACDRLQRDLAPRFDLSGYVV